MPEAIGTDLSSEKFGRPGSASEGGQGASPTNVISRGFVRSSTDKLMVVSNTTSAATPLSRNGGDAKIMAFATQGATALKGEPVEQVSFEKTLDTLAWTQPNAASGQPERARSGDSVADKRAEARMKGYVGESCPECANFTLVRNGTCLKCDTCGSTTGCS